MKHSIVPGNWDWRTAFKGPRNAIKPGDRGLIGDKIPARRGHNMLWLADLTIVSFFFCLI